MFVLSGVIFSAIFIVCVAYLYHGATLQETKARTRQAKKMAKEKQEAETDESAEDSEKGSSRLRMLVPLLVKRLVANSTIIRILLAYVQCVTIPLRFQNVVWPRLFASFLGVLEHATIDIFALVPAECAINQR